MGTEPKKGTQMVGIVWYFQQLIYSKGDLVINYLTNEQYGIRDVMGSERGYRKRTQTRFILLYLQLEGHGGFRECDACDKSMAWGMAWHNTGLKSFSWIKIKNDWFRVTPNTCIEATSTS